MTEEEKMETERAIAWHWNRTANQAGLFRDPEPGTRTGHGVQVMPYRELLHDITEAALENKDQKTIDDMQMLHYASIVEDTSGEGYIYEIIAYGLEVYDFAGTEDLFNIFRKMGLMLEDFIASRRLQRGLFKTFRLHYPEKLNRAEYAFLFANVDPATQKFFSQIINIIIITRKIPMKNVTADDVIAVTEDNREILTLYREIKDYVCLTSTFPKDGEAGKIYMAIVTNEPTQGGSLMYYCNGTYRLQQYLLDWPGKKELLNDVTELQTLEEAKETALLMFDHSSDSEKALYIPLSRSSYAKTSYPFEHFDICYPEGEDGELSSSQRACEFSMSIFFSGMKEESKEFLRDKGVPKPEEVTE